MNLLTGTLVYCSLRFLTKLARIMYDRCQKQNHRTDVPELTNFSRQEIQMYTKKQIQIKPIYRTKLQSHIIQSYSAAVQSGVFQGVLFLKLFGFFIFFKNALKMRQNAAIIALVLYFDNFKEFSLYFLIQRLKNNFKLRS